MSNKQEQIAVIDLGNGTTSYLGGNGKSGSFSSLVAEFTGSRAAEGFNRELFKLKNGRQYLVGEDCREEGAATRSTDSSFYKSVEIKVLFLKALKDLGIKAPLIVTGLPTEFVATHKQDFEKNLRTWAAEEGFNPSQIVILPQYVGPLFDPELLDEEGKQIPPALIAKGKFGVIDIGHGTTDAGQIVDGKGSQHRFGMSKGVSDFHKELLAHLKTPESMKSAASKKGQKLPQDFKVDKQTNEHTMDAWMRQGHISWRGEKLDIFAISHDLRVKFADQILPQVIDQIWGSTDLLEGMICAGGGMKILGHEILKRYIHCKIYMANDPSMSIVRGYYRYAKTQLVPVRPTDAVKG